MLSLSVSLTNNTIIYLPTWTTTSHRKFSFRGIFVVVKLLHQFSKLTIKRHPFIATTDNNFILKPGQGTWWHGMNEHLAIRILRDIITGHEESDDAAIDVSGNESSSSEI